MNPASVHALGLLEITAEGLRFLISLILFSYLLANSKHASVREQRGWKLIFLGFFLLVLGTGIDFFPNIPGFESWYPLGGEWFQKRIFQDAFGYLGGFIFVSWGIILWLPGILERAHLKSKLIEEHDQLKIILNSIDDAVITLSDTQEIDHMNHAAEMLTGWTLKSAQGRPFYEIVKLKLEDDESDFNLNLHQWNEQKNSQNIFEKIILLRRDQTTIPVAIHISVLKSSQNNQHGMVLVLRDISTERRMQHEMIKSSQLESVGLLAGGVAHDFNNILTGILGNLELAQLAPEDSPKFIERAFHAARRARSLVAQLLSFSKKKKPFREVFNLKKTIQEASEFALSGSNCSLKLDLDPNLYAFNGDANQIAQVIQNLIINASQSMSEEGEVILNAKNLNLDEIQKRSLKYSSNMIEIQIIDHGTGIPEKNYSRIFDPFFTTKEKGTGLGLAICQKIITEHHGSLEVLSTSSQGTTFGIFLPAEMQNIVDSGKNDSVHTMTGSGKILVLDDEKSIQEIYQSMLKSMGYQVELFSSGDQALTVFKQSQKSADPFVAIILDLTIPGELGADKLIWKFNAIDSHIKAIIATGYSEDPILNSFETHGFQGILIKPFTSNSLAKALHKILN